MPARLAACGPLAGAGLACTSLQGGTAVSASSDLVSATTSWPRCRSSRICGRNKERQMQQQSQSSLDYGLYKVIRGCAGQRPRVTGRGRCPHLLEQHL
jgi:hypothetical protein